VDGGSGLDARSLDHAFALAEEGRGRVHPNPLVGAVVVAKGQVVGRGAHLGPGLPHAEIVALREAGEKARGSTLYCTLEPCAHQGRTPPCTEALLAAGVARVVVAMQDPNPLVDGSGMAQLRAGGVQVELAGPEAAARAAALNRPFIKFVHTGLPFVTYKAAISLDGKVAAASGDARWISGEQSRALVHAWRARADAVLVGAGTVRRDDPLLTVRAVAGRSPLRVVLTRGGDLPLDSELFATVAQAPVLVLAEHIDERRRAALTELGVEVAVVDQGPAAALRLLADRGALEILCEGGPTLAGELLAAGLIDRIALFVAPVVIGRGAPDLLALPASPTVADGIRLRDVTWRQVGDDLLVEGRPESASQDGGH
jgi:diaminohydroxyphosphoribosylaminopyrimidine deaminase / 5-amino-6-(5-phosphoribosylamino)uracil reductase